MVNVAFPSHTHASVTIYLVTPQHLTSFARYLHTEHLRYPIGCQINSRPSGRYKNVNCSANDWLPCVETMIDETLYSTAYVCPIACVVVVATALCLRKICVSLPEKFLQTGIAESVSTCGNLDGFPHCFATQRTLKASLGLLQELVVEPRHCWFLH